MEKSQLDNLINFVFVFHRQNYNHIHELVKRSIEEYKLKYLREYNIILLV